MVPATSSFPVDDGGPMANLSSPPDLVAGLEGQAGSSGQEAGSHPAVRSSMGRLNTIPLAELFCPASHTRHALTVPDPPRLDLSAFAVDSGQSRLAKRPVERSRTRQTGRPIDHHVHVRVDHGRRWSGGVPVDLSSHSRGCTATSVKLATPIFTRWAVHSILESRFPGEAANAPDFFSRSLAMAREGGG